jgi:hypothetical protein
MEYDEMVRDGHTDVLISDDNDERVLIHFRDCDQYHWVSEGGVVRVEPGEICGATSCILGRKGRGVPAVRTKTESRFWRLDPDCTHSGGNPVAMFTFVLIGDGAKCLIDKARKGGRVV